MLIQCRIAMFVFIKFGVSGQELGLEGFVPPYMAPETTGDAVFRGVNYASGGGGILNQTGSIFVSTLNSSFLCEIFICSFQ